MYESFLNAVLGETFLSVRLADGLELLAGNMNCWQFAGKYELLAACGGI